MSYRESEREKAVKIRDRILRDPGDGIFLKKEREFVLKNPILNLWAGIRHDAIDYFERNDIAWWMGEEPTGHLLSSQVSCLNHLYFLRQRKGLATRILMNINPQIVEALVVDDGYVEFEAIGSKNYLNEKSHIRGANSTSVDAIMVGKKSDGIKILVLIEWKYTEFYDTESKYIQRRYELYDPLILDEQSPFTVQTTKALYYEPFYQLMRQTLLGWKMIDNKEYGCNEYLHVHVIPNKNIELRDKVTSPLLQGDTMSDAWKSVIKDDKAYKIIDPMELLKDIDDYIDTKSIIQYLNDRYWN